MPQLSLKWSVCMFAFHATDLFSQGQDATQGFILEHVRKAEGQTMPWVRKALGAKTISHTQAKGTDGTET